MSTEPAHPAPYSDGIIDIFQDKLEVFGSLMPGRSRQYVLDPNAGVGRIHQMDDRFFKTYGVEIEAEWAKAHPATRLGDATNMYWFADKSFDAICVSPTYGNRMADSHTVSPCKSCGGQGSEKLDGHLLICADCNGTGKSDNSKRITYTHILGRKLHPNNTGQMQWGRKYRRLYIQIWDECIRVLKDDGLFILNCSDHIRKGQVIEVTKWHKDLLESYGFVHLDRQEVKTSRMKYGANSHLRVEFETIDTFRKVAA